MKKKKLLIIGGIIIFSSILIIRKKCTKKKEEEEPKSVVESKPETADELLTKLIKDLLRSGDWKNERDFLSKITKQFITEAKDLTWIDFLPVCLDDLMDKLRDLGLLEEFEKELEDKYVGRGNK